MPVSPWTSEPMELILSFINHDVLELCLLEFMIETIFFVNVCDLTQMLVMVCSLIGADHKWP